MRIQCKRIFDLDHVEKNTIGEKNDYLTVGKVYVVLVLYANKDGVDFQIEADDGRLYIFKSTAFHVVSDEIPSNWELTYSPHATQGSYHLILAPKAWNRYKGYFGESFYDEIVEVEGALESWRHETIRSPVLDVYFEEKDIIHGLTPMRFS